MYLQNILLFFERNTRHTAIWYTYASRWTFRTWTLTKYTILCSNVHQNIRTGKKSCIFLFFHFDENVRSLVPFNGWDNIYFVCVSCVVYTIGIYIYKCIRYICMDFIYFACSFYNKRKTTRRKTKSNCIHACLYKENFHVHI